MLRVDIDRIVGDSPTVIVVERLPRIWVDVESREVAAGNVQPNPVTTLEQQRRWIHLDREFVRSAGLQPFSACRITPIPRPDDPIRDVESDA